MTSTALKKAPALAIVVCAIISQALHAQGAMSNDLREIAIRCINEQQALGNPFIDAAGELHADITQVRFSEYSDARVLSIVFQSSNTYPDAPMFWCNYSRVTDNFYVLGHSAQGQEQDWRHEYNHNYHLSAEQYKLLLQNRTTRVLPVSEVLDDSLSPR